MIVLYETRSKRLCRVRIDLFDFDFKLKRLLKEAPEIWAILQLKVLTPTEFLAAYRHNSQKPS